MRAMNQKPHHKRRSPNSERNLVFLLAGFLLVMVLGLLGLFLWWTNSPLH